MKHTITPNEYQDLALRTEKTPVFATTHQMSQLLHASIGICTETGELQDAIKKHLIYGKSFDLVNVMEECGDLLWYIALALKASGYTMVDAMERNIEKLKARFPDGFTEDKALNRDLVTERTILENNKDE